jgi:hypothetical protein
MTKSCIALALAMALAPIGACGGSLDGGDDDGPGGDAGPSGDAGESGPLADIAGAWEWRFTPAGAAEPAIVCSVHLGGSTFDVSCPEDGFPATVGDGCTQVRQEWHASGTLRAGLSGSLDQIVEFSGESCALHGYTTGAPYPLPPWAVMSADHLLELPLSGFLAALGGKWVWTLAEAQDPTAQTGCSVDLGLDQGVTVAISCPTSEAKTVVPMCQAQDHVEIDALLVPGALTGTVTPVVKHTGAGCGANFPPEVRGAPAAMDATPAD